MVKGHNYQEDTTVAMKTKMNSPFDICMRVCMHLDVHESGYMCLGLGHECVHLRTYSYCKI